MQLSDSILESSLWGLDPATKIVWITMVYMADSLGRVRASKPGLARRAHVPLEDVERALELFSTADPHSRTPTYDGRRIMRIDGGWTLINFAKYHEPMAGVTVVNPDMGRFVPKSWQPNDGHRGRCLEFLLDVKELEAAFRAHEFNRDYGDWDRCFDRWIMRTRVQQGVRPPVKGKPANETRWQPSDKHKAYAKKFGLTAAELQQAALEWSTSEQPQRYDRKEQEYYFGRKLENLVRAKRGAA